MDGNVEIWQVKYWSTSVKHKKTIGLQPKQKGMFDLVFEFMSRQQTNCSYELRLRRIRWHARSCGKDAVRFCRKCARDLRKCVIVFGWTGQRDAYTMACRCLTILQVCDLNTGYRKKLLDVLYSFLDIDNVQIMRLPLSETKVTVRVDDALSAPFNSTVDTPQGDSLSPVLFTVYLKAALWMLCRRLPNWPQFIHRRRQLHLNWPWLPEQSQQDRVNSTGRLVPVRQCWQNSIQSSRCRRMEDDQETWIPSQNCLAEKCLQSLLSISYGLFGCEEQHISEQLRLYNAFILPVLLYNACALGLMGLDTSMSFTGSSSAHSLGFTGHSW